MSLPTASTWSRSARHGPTDRPPDLAHPRADPRLRLFRPRPLRRTRRSGSWRARLLRVAIRADGSDLGRARGSRRSSTSNRLTCAATWPAFGTTSPPAACSTAARRRRRRAAAHPGPGGRRVIGRGGSRRYPRHAARGRVRASLGQAAVHGTRVASVAERSPPCPVAHAQTLLREFRGNITVAMTAEGIDGCEALVTHARDRRDHTRDLAGKSLLVRRPVGRGGRVAPRQRRCRHGRHVHGSGREEPTTGRGPTDTGRATWPTPQPLRRRGLQATPSPLPADVRNDRHGRSVHDAAVIAHAYHPTGVS